MSALLTFRFHRRRGSRNLVHAGAVEPAEGWGPKHVYLRLLCRPARSRVVSWVDAPAATAENVTCPRCLRALRPAAPHGSSPMLTDSHGEE